MTHITIDELRRVPIFSDLPDETLRWVIERSEVQTFGVDEILSKTGEPIESMWIIISGNYDFYWDTNGQLTYIRTWNEGHVTGLLPYSRMKTSPGYTISTSPGRSLLLHKRHFEEMEKRFPELTKRLVEVLTDRVREFTASHQQQEKMSALGRMSAGLAHELNNPAAAIQRSSAELNNRLIGGIDRVLGLIESHPDKKQITEILLMLQKKAAGSYYNNMSALERAQREDELIDRLGNLSKNARNQVAETFAEICLTPDELEEIVDTLAPDSAEKVLLWIENIITSERLVTEIQKASSRISQLVNSIKSYVHMDRSYDMQPTDIHGGLESTLILLNHKLRQKNIHVVKNYAENLPHIEAFPGEINQIWTNIIDNAIDAMQDEGKLAIATSLERGMVKVCITDTGHGIPKELMSKIFDPFFTTKSIGKGIGLGLDLVKGIIRKHNGEIKVSSVPGKTEFSICFPVTQKRVQQESPTDKATL